MQRALKDPVQLPQLLYFMNALFMPFHAINHLSSFRSSVRSESLSIFWMEFMLLV